MIEELSPSAQRTLRDTDDAAIGRAIQTLRILRSMTLQNLAAAADLTFEYASRIEEGNAIISSWALVRIARALRVDGAPEVGAPNSEIIEATAHLRQNFLQASR